MSHSGSERHNFILHTSKFWAYLILKDIKSTWCKIVVSLQSMLKALTWGSFPLCPKHTWNIQGRLKFIKVKFKEVHFHHHWFALKADSFHLIDFDVDWIMFIWLVSIWELVHFWWFNLPRVTGPLSCVWAPVV